jgi:hypothetical protein
VSYELSVGGSSEQSNEWKIWGFKSSADDCYLLKCFTLLTGKQLVVTDLKVNQSYRLNSLEFLVLKTHDDSLIVRPRSVKSSRKLTLGVTKVEIYRRTWFLRRCN